MALTPAQQQYLDKLNVGSGMGTAGAIGGAGKGAAIGTTIMPGVGTAIGAGLGFLGGLFGGKSKAKQAQAEAKAKLEQANAAFNQGEDTRLARASAGQSLLQGLTGKGFTQLSPEVVASLMKRRELDPALVGLTNPGAGAVSGALSGLVDTVGDFATQYGLNKQRNDAAASDEMAGPSTVDIARTPNFMVAPKDKIASSLYEDPQNYKGY